MPSWIEGHRLRCGPLTDAASIFGASLGVERDPPNGARGLLALARAIERHARGAEPDGDGERLFVELSGAYLGVLLCDALGQARHAIHAGRHGLQLGTQGFFDPFAVIERALGASDVRACLAEHVARAEAEANGDATVASHLAWQRARARIVPRLVGPRFFERLSQQLTPSPVYRLELVPGVSVCFVLREPGRARYVVLAEARSWQQEPSALLGAALGNLARQSSHARLLRVDAEQGTLIVAATGDGLDASRLLLPGLHDVLAPELGSPFAVAIPHRDALLACSLDSKAALEALRERARLEGERAAHAITSDLLQLDAKGRLAPLSL